MASQREYLGKMHSDQLRELLRANDSGQLDLPVDTVLLICQILQEREPSKMTVREAFRYFVGYYLNDVDSALI